MSRLSAGGIIAIVLIIIALVMLIVGIILFERDVSNKVSSQWYVWFLLIGGLILGIIGGIWLAYDLRRHNMVKVGVPGSTVDAGTVELTPVQPQVYAATVQPQITTVQPQVYAATVQPQVTTVQPQTYYTASTYAGTIPPPQQANYAGYMPMQQTYVAPPQQTSTYVVPPQQIVSGGIGQ